MCTIRDGCEQCQIPKALVDARRANDIKAVEQLIGLCTLRKSESTPQLKLTTTQNVFSDKMSRTVYRANLSH